MNATILDAGPVDAVHSSQMRCGSCGWDNPAGIIFCTNCGKRISDRGPVVTAASGSLAVAAVAAQAAVAPAAAMPATKASKCGRCGASSDPGMRFCRECGASLADEPTPPSGTSPKALECARCHAPREASARFCRYCGASHDLTGVLANAPAEAAPAPGRSPASSPGVPVASVARLVTLLKDGSEGRSIALGEQDQDIGASEGDITFPDDPYLSPRHARIACRAGNYTLRDLDSVNGVYVRLREPVEVRDRDVVLIGQQVLRFELLGEGELPLGPATQKGVLVFGTPEAARFARLVQYTTEGVGRDVHYLFRDETVVGRENGDIVFTDDPFLSRRHAALRVDHAASRFTLHDLGSSNGTAIRIRGEHVLRDGDQFRIGRHLFRFEAGATSGAGVGPGAGSNPR